MLEYITLFVIVVFMGIMIIIIASSGFKSTATKAIFACGTNECATNIQSGFKRCPVAGELLRYDQGTEVCNPMLLCNSPITPFAIMSDGSTNINGVCEPGVPCSCTHTIKCPNYVLASFTAINGSAFSQTQGTRITFPQSTTGTNPIVLGNSDTQFCKVPIEWFSRATPGCNFIDQNDPTIEQLKVCMGLPNNCNGALGNPCLSGTLAIINPGIDIDTTQLFKYEMGCVEGSPCSCGEIAVYDTNYGGIVCI